MSTACYITLIGIRRKRVTCNIHLHVAIVLYTSRDVRDVRDDAELALHE